jgi:hypothetical protein
LKPGGRLAISDIIGTAPLPAVLAADPALVCGCVAGAAPAERIEAWLNAAGFVDIRITAKPESRALIETWAPGRGVEDYIASAIIEGRKPGIEGRKPGIEGRKPGIEGRKPGIEGRKPGSAPAAVDACCAPSCCAP